MAATDDMARTNSSYDPSGSNYLVSKVQHRLQNRRIIILTPTYIVPPIFFENFAFSAAAQG